MNKNIKIPVSAPPPLEKCVYLITFDAGHNGFFCVFYHLCLSYILYAKDRGYIPFIDLAHNYNQYFKDGMEYRDNVWEYFYKQPEKLSSDEIKKQDRKIIFSKYDDIIKYREYLDKSVMNSLLDKSQNLSKDFFNYISFNSETEKFLEDGYKKTIGDNEVLGILCRGTDYIERRPPRHSMQPAPGDVIRHAKEVLQKSSCKKIYLATEDFKIYEKFKKEFGDILIDNPQYKYSFCDGKFLSEIKVERKNHHYNLAKEYLLSIYILSKCKHLILGQTGALLGIWYFSKGFKNQKYLSVYDIGKYRIKKEIAYNHFLERFFSIKNELKEDTKRKVVTILGIKFKILKKSNKKRTIGFDRI